MIFIFNVFLCLSVFISSLSFSSEGVIENTPISISSSFKSIEDITTADTVISCDTSSMECRENKVLTDSTCIYTDVIKITTGAGRELSLALEQQVFIEAKGWLTGDKLELYDCLIDINGYQDYIVAIEPSEHKQPVYIFAVARDHNFYADGVLVHNPGWGDFFSAVGNVVADVVTDAFVPDCEAKVKSGGFKGGAHKNTKNPVGDGLDSHHMPAKSVSPLKPNDSPAIQMEPADHRMTRTHNHSGPGADAYRQECKKMIEDGRIRDVIAADIKDIREISERVTGGNPTKYNKPMIEMLDYAKAIGFIDKK